MRSEFRISLRFVWIYDTDVRYNEVRCNCGTLCRIDQLKVLVVRERR